MKLISHRKPKGKTYLKVRFVVYPKRLTFEVLEQHPAITAGPIPIVCPSYLVKSIAFPELTEDEIFIRGYRKALDKNVASMDFFDNADRDRYLAWAQQALIDAEPRIIELCEGKK